MQMHVHARRELAWVRSRVVRPSHSTRKTGGLSIVGVGSRSRTRRLCTLCTGDLHMREIDELPRLRLSERLRCLAVATCTAHTLYANFVGEQRPGNWRRCIRSWTSIVEIDQATLLAAGEPHDLSSRPKWRGFGSRLATSHSPGVGGASVDRLVPRASCHQHACASSRVLCLYAVEFHQLRTAVLRAAAAAISDRSRQ
jgi:hypothetical protein